MLRSLPVGPGSWGGPRVFILHDQGLPPHRHGCTVAVEGGFLVYLNSAAWEGLKAGDQGALVTLAHELAHVVLHRELIPPNGERPSGQVGPEVEDQAEGVAWAVVEELTGAPLELSDGVRVDAGRARAFANSDVGRGAVAEVGGGLRTLLKQRVCGEFLRLPSTDPGPG